MQWKKLSQHLRGFSFVFYQFKLHYLASLYKTFRDSACLYSQPSTPVLDPAYFNPVQDKHGMYYIVSRVQNIYTEESILLGNKVSKRIE